MSFLVVQAYLQLTSFESCLKQSNFAAVYDRVHNDPLSTHLVTPDTVTRICAAIDMACAWYWKETLCLQRSAATVCLLRRYGVKAQLVIATRHIPFQAHAWVEVEGEVVNDKPDVQQTYAVLDRF